ncbi:hypothetical protein [Sphaerisporangium sp. NPDC051011]|uniref:hypothetical protein n=1 Tax=Sphaerisporangium sp. NPDC051011 TaxID=3155792 RepID=UPI0033E8956E
MFDAQDARTAIGVIIGQPFMEVGRIGHMAILGFGREVSWASAGTAELVTGRECALHVNCAFRMTQKARIIFGSDDMYETLPVKRVSADDSMESRSIYDDRADVIEKVLQNGSGIVQDVSVGAVGDLRIQLNSAVTIEVFPASSTSAEAWRFLVRFGAHYSFPEGPSSP